MSVHAPPRTVDLCHMLPPRNMLRPPALPALHSGNTPPPPLALPCELVNKWRFFHCTASEPRLNNYNYYASSILASADAYQLKGC